MQSSQAEWPARRIAVSSTAGASAGQSQAGRPRRDMVRRGTWFRDGLRNTADDGTGSHVISLKVTAEFLAFAARRGNDLSI